MRPHSRSTLAVLFLLLTALPLFAGNPIQTENLKPGDPNWDVVSEANGEIEGYASATSVNRGESISFYVNTTEPNYTLEIFRMGWYNGAGARRMTQPITLTGIKQPMPTADSTGLIECRWTNPYTITIPNGSDPTDWASGIYLVRLTAGTSQKQKFIIFVVRDDARATNHLFQSSVTTFQAYNNWGGRSLYSFNSTNGAAQRVSFNRPYTQGAGTGDFLWQWEYNMVRFLEREGYDVSYITDIDSHRRPNVLQNHKDLLSVGHDEYWSAEMRGAWENARSRGQHLGFFSANTCYWQIRLQPSTVDATQLDRTMIGYKESYKQDPYYTDSDPSNDKYVTNMWRAAPVSNSEDALLGVYYIYDGPSGHELDSDIVLDDVTSAPWVFAGTGLNKGDHLVGMLGYEVDAMAARTPAGTIRLGHSPFTNWKVSPTRTDYSDMTLYTAASGSIVFAAGSMQLPWGLDDWNMGRGRVSPAIQRMTRNILDRFAGNNAAADCQYALSPASQTGAVTGGTGTLQVTAGVNCSWTATSSAPWLTINTGTSGTGSGTITFSFPGNAGPERTATITVGDRVMTFTQGGGCTYDLTPSTTSVPAAGGSGTIRISVNASECPWNPSVSVPWISISPSSGSGDGTINFTVAVNQGPQRRGTITIGNASVTISQANGCVYSVSPSTASIGASGGNVNLTLTTSSQGCYWASSTNDPWLTLATPDNGQGNAAVVVSVAANTGAQRSGSATIAGQLVTFSQAGQSCSASISPSTANIGSRGGTIAVTVTMNTGCPWTAVSNSSFISVTSGASGSGTGNVTLVVASNSTGAPRTGTVTIAGLTFTVTQSDTANKARGDLNADSRSDMVWQNMSTGDVWVWLMNGSAIGTSRYLTTVANGYEMQGVGDFDGDGQSDLVWVGTGGDVWIWLMNGLSIRASSSPYTVAANYRIAATGDFDGDGQSDILWFNTVTRDTYIWLMNGTSIRTSSYLYTVAANYTLAATGDFDGDRKSDLVWFNTVTRDTYIWLMNGTTYRSSTYIYTAAANYAIAGVGDYDGDQKSDLVWFNAATGDTYLWFMNSTAIRQSTYIYTAASNFRIVATGDFNGDGNSDFVWRNGSTGDTYIWLMNGATISSSTFIYAPTTSWKPIAPGVF